MNKPLDNNFMKRTTQITAFNMQTSDFQTDKFKSEIQHLYRNHMFGSFDPTKDPLKTLDALSFNRLVKKLKTDNKSQFIKLHNLPLKGIGPSEAVFFLLTEDGVLGGGSSAGVDLIMGSSKYEIKAVKWKSKARKDFVSDFRLGGSVPGITNLLGELQELAASTKVTQNSNTSEISGAKMELIEKADPTAYQQIRSKYKTLAYENYFRRHKTIFVQNESNQPDYGEIISIMNVLPKDIEMERATAGTIKPLVKIR